MASELSSLLNPTLRRRALGLPQLVHRQMAKKFSFLSALLRIFPVVFGLGFWFCKGWGCNL